MDAIRRVHQGIKRRIRLLRGIDPNHHVQVKLPKERHGTLYGGWQVCPEYITEESVVYAFGVGEDISFDLSLIERYGIRVYAFDPTPKAIAFVESQQLPEQFTLITYGIADYDGTARFFPPDNPAHVSHTLLEKKEVEGIPIEVEVRCLRTLMEMHGHDHIDVLKMDVEGAEYAVVEDLVQSHVPVTQLLIEYHHRLRSVGKEKTEESVQLLNKNGYEIFSISPSGEEYAFIRRERIQS